MIQQIDTAFSNATQRARVSWCLAVSMTCVAFVLITGMIVAALVLTFLKGEGGWGVVFGGASACTIVGVLLWRPFDRIFRATIVAQQIEMIHVQATSSYRATSDLEKRIEICREATEGLRTLLREHDVADSRMGTSRRVTKRKKTKQPDKSTDNGRQNREE